MERSQQNITGSEVPPRADLYDLSDIKLLSANDDALFGKLLNVLVSMFNEEIINIRTNAVVNNWQVVAGSAHKLKTSLTHIRAEPARLIVRNIEDHEYHTDEELKVYAGGLCKTLEHMLVYLEEDIENFEKK